MASIMKILGGIIYRNAGHSGNRLSGNCWQCITHIGINNVENNEKKLRLEKETIIKEEKKVEKNNRQKPQINHNHYHVTYYEVYFVL
jgi:hypothetical protein